MPYKDPAKAKAAAKARYVAKREQILAAAKARYELKREEIIAAQLIRQNSNREEYLSYQRDYAKQNRERNLERKHEWRLANPDRSKEQNTRNSRSWRESNRARYNSIQRVRNVHMKSPVWACEEEIENLYRHAAELTKQTGTPHHVDHIIPLRGKSVCGLHVPANLRVITAAENLRKSNLFVEGGI